jgi:hypothetical protein
VPENHGGYREDRADLIGCEVQAERSAMCDVRPSPV